MVRNRILLIIGIVMSAIFVSFYGGIISYTFFYMFLLLPVLSCVYMIYVYLRFCVYQLIERKTIVKGEHIPYQFILANEDFITYTSVNVTFLHQTSEVEALNELQCYCLLPGEQYNYKTTLCCKYRGEYFAGIDKVQVRDFLGLFHITYPSPSTINVKVLPRIVRLSNLVFFEESDSKQLRQTTAFRQTIPDIEVRNYEKGDSVKQIQWKLTAREQKLLSKKYTEDQKSEILLLMDMTKVKDNELNQIIIEDKIIEAVLAVIDFYFRKNIEVTLLYDLHGIQKVEIHNKAAYDTFYQVTTELNFRSSLRVADLLLKANRYTNKKNFCMIVTHTITEELCIACFEAIQFGDEIVIIYINKMNNDVTIEHLDARIHFYRIDLDQEVSDVLDQV